MIRVILAGILSLIFPGIGQIFNRQWLKGIALVVVELSIIYFLVPNTWITILFRLIWLYAIIDAVVVALRARKGISKSQGLTGIKAVAGVGVSLLIVLPLAWFPKFLPDIILGLAAKSDEIIEQNVPDGQFDEEKELYKSYLEERYGEKFILGEGSYSSKFEHYIIDAHPKDNEEITFTVFLDENDEYYDTYIRTKWTIEAEEQLDPFIRSLYEDMWTYDFDMAFKTHANDVILEENDVIPSFEESSRKYGELYQYSVMVYVFKDMNDGNKHEELERMYEVITFFEENDIRVGSFEIEYYSEELQGKISKDTEPDLLEHGDYASFFLSVGQKKIDEIHTPGDIEKYLVDLRE